MSIKEQRHLRSSDHLHWVWTDASRDESTENLRRKFADLKARGIGGVFLSVADDREYDLVREAGLKLHVWMWTTNRGDAWIGENHPEWYQVSRSGKSCHDQPPYVGYYKWVNPVLPEVRAYIRDRAGDLAAKPQVQGVHLDYVRYPDVILPRALWKTYNLDQTEELDDYDFSYDDFTRAAFRAESGRDPKEIANPAADAEWIHFRQRQVVGLVEEIQKAVKAEGKELSAAVFPTPAMARTICRQDWDKFPLDLVAPMIYHSFYEESVDWIGDCVREGIQAVRFPLFAGLYLPGFNTPAEFEAGIKLALRRGASGVSLFGGVSPEMWAAFERGISA